MSGVIGDLAAQAYAAHAMVVYGTATPERVGTAGETGTSGKEAAE